MAKKNKSRFTYNAIIGDDTPFSVIEAFKATRTNLMFMLDSKRDKNSIVFTSFAPRDGKTTTCLNLAITFAQTGAKVLVIDADMRKPAIHRYMKIQSKPGLSDYLGDLSDSTPSIYKTAIENLYVLPAGTIPPNPTELLMSKNMEKLLDDCGTLFDYIFIDTPPIGLVTDAAIVAAKTLGIINVINCDHTTSEEIENIVQTVDQAGVNLIGCIINAVPWATTNKKYRYRSSNYGYSYSSVDAEYYNKYYTGHLKSENNEEKNQKDLSENDE